MYHTEVCTVSILGHAQNTNGEGPEQSALLTQLLRVFELGTHSGLFQSQLFCLSSNTSLSLILWQFFNLTFGFV